MLFYRKVSQIKKEEVGEFEEHITSLEGEEYTPPEGENLIIPRI